MGGMGVKGIRPLDHSFRSSLAVLPQNLVGVEARSWCQAGLAILRTLVQNSRVSHILGTSKAGWPQLPFVCVPWVRFLPIRTSNVCLLEISGVWELLGCIRQIKSNGAHLSICVGPFSWKNSGRHTMGMVLEQESLSLEGWESSGLILHRLDLPFSKSH